MTTKTVENIFQDFQKSPEGEEKNQLAEELLELPLTLPPKTLKPAEAFPEIVSFLSEDWLFIIEDLFSLPLITSILIDFAPRHCIKSLNSLYLSINKELSYSE